MREFCENSINSVTGAVTVYMSLLGWAIVVGHQGQGHLDYMHKVCTEHSHCENIELMSTGQDTKSNLEETIMLCKHE